VQVIHRFNRNLSGLVDGTGSIFELGGHFMGPGDQLASPNYICVVFGHTYPSSEFVRARVPFHQVPQVDIPNVL